jgi:hypothetical protein
MIKNYFKTAWRNIVKSKGIAALKHDGAGNGHGCRLADRAMGALPIFV